MVGQALTSFSLPGNDPDVYSWLVTALELAAAAAAAMVAGSMWGDRRARFFWVVVGLVMTVFALNKQLDAQTHLVTIGHEVFDAPGYRGLRASALPITAVTVAGLSSVVLASLVWGSRGLSHFRLAFTGTLVLFVFALLRAADIVEPRAFPGHSGHAVALPVEALGAALILVSALRQGRSQRAVDRDGHPTFG